MNYWSTEVTEFLANKQFDRVINFYEDKIDFEPDNINYYWCLGLSYLLAKREEEAQTTWFLPLIDADDSERDFFNGQLLEILEEEAKTQTEKENYQQSWLIRQYIRQDAPESLNNLLELLKLEFILNTFNPIYLTEWGIIELIKNSPINTLNHELLEYLLKKILDCPSFESIDFAKAILIYTQGDDYFLKKIFNLTLYISYVKQLRLYGIDLFKLCLEYQPHNLLFLKEAFWNYAVAEKYAELKETGDVFYDYAETTVQKAFGSYQLIYIRMVGADWLEAISLSERHEYLLTQLANEQPDYMEDFIRDSLMVISQPLLYIHDKPRENRWIYNQLGKLFQKHCQNNFSCPIHSLSHSHHETQVSRKLRIGYIGHTMKKHSVGYLSRWLMHYHNKEEFVIGFYFVNNSLNADDINREWFIDKGDIVVGFGHDVNAIVREIENDRIDILVDLDSFTFNITGCVMALKPAPIQVSWLGMDSNGIPAIDYFITDPYVLPNDAQEYYQEKIWRLPHTYLGIDGFEVGVPNITRKDLEIPEDAIVYFNIQNALKRHPDHIRTQMKILQAVPESYLLIKGTGKQDIVKDLFTQIAQSEGIDIFRLKFLDRSPTEAIHRANLRIADVILDTYPYNGATTTLETLWMEMPMVTRVGEQFAARNSYTFMINAGITEGIAYSEAEYIEWAIKLGRDENLRKQVTLKLKESKKTSPLWNGEQFTREMEKAYKQMWQIYIEGK